MLLLIVHGDIGGCEVGMAKDPLQPKLIATVHDIGHRRAMPQQMWMQTGNAGSFAKALDRLGQGTAGQAFPLGVDKYRLGAIPRKLLP